MKTHNSQHGLPSGGICQRTRKAMFSITASLMVSVLAFLFSPLAQADVNVLIIGSTQGSDVGYLGARTPFDPTQIKTELEKILGGAGLGTVNVTLENRANVNMEANALASWYYWPKPADADLTRWSNLRGQNGTPWDYVVVIGDPFTIEQLPGAFCQGVSQIAEEVAKGTAKTVLLMNWPGASTTSSVAHFKEMVYRTANTTGCIVAPAALAWQAAGSPTGTTHPTSDGAYIAAASIYSSVLGQNANASTYKYTNTTLANTVYTTVTNNVGKSQYTGIYDASGRSKFFNDKRRGWGVDCYWPKSSDWMTAAQLTSLISENRMTAVTESRTYPKAVFLSCWNGDGSAYPMNCAFAFPGNDNSTTIDSFLTNVGYDISFCDSQAGDAVNYRRAPIYLIWAGYSKLYPSEMPIQGQHFSNDGRMATAAYMYTMFSGRCPLAPKPNPVNSSWTAKKLGYEAAWRMGHVQGRAPGFRTLPSSANRLKMAPGQTETMTVQFVLPLQSNVTVNVSVSDPNMASVSPTQLTFTPENYTTDQQVVVTGLGGASASSNFNVEFSTISGDEICNGLQDSWQYGRTLPPVITKAPWADVSPVTLPAGAYVNVTATDPEGDPLTYSWSKVSGPGNVTFSPNGSGSSSRSAVSFSKPGTYVLQVGVSDGSTPVTGQMTIQVLNGMPIANSQSLEAYMNTPLNVLLTGFDPNGDTLTYSIVNNPAHGTLSGIAPNFTYTPALNFTGTDSFTFKANDGTDDSAIATVTLSYSLNHPPVVSAGGNVYVTMSATTNLWTPAKNKTAVWYDASDASTLWANTAKTIPATDSVLAWADKSGNNKTIVAASGSEPQTGTTNKIGGLPVLYFASGDKMNSSTNITLPAGGNLATFMVYDYISGGTYIYNNFGPTFNGGSGSLDFAGKAFSGNPYNDPIIVENVCDWDARSYKSYVTGINKMTSATYTTQLGTSLGLLLFRNNNGAAGLSANLGEFIAVDDLTDPTRQRIEGYLAWKWGMQLNLAADHPYKSGAPRVLLATVTLDGAVSDADGGNTLVTSWSVVSGNPANVVIQNPAAVDTTADFYAEGNYILRLTVSDGTVVRTSDIAVKVNDPSIPNLAPVIKIDRPNAATNYMAYADSLMLEATVTDDDRTTSAVTYAWSKVSGPGTATFESPTSADTTVWFEDFVPGTYVLRLTASDGALQTTKDVTVSFGNYSPPTGQSLAPQIDLSSVGMTEGQPGIPYALHAAVRDDSLPNPPGYLNTMWEVLSGPGNAVFENTGALDTTMTCDTQGTYVLRFTADDGGAKTYDQATVRITGTGNMPPVVNAGPDQTVLLSGSTPWTPAGISCAAWYDASTATLNTGIVTVVNAGTQGGSISGPAALAASGIGSLQAVNFNGTSRYLTGNYTNTGTTLSAFFVGKSLNTTQLAYAGMMDVWATGQASDWNNVGSAVLFSQNNTTPNSVYTHRNAVLSSATGALTNGFIAATVFDGSTNTHYLNGAASASVASAGAFNTAKVAMGGRWNTSSFNTWWNGNFGEAILCNASLSTSDRQKIEGYLAHKWGMAASLPADHPYKSAAPGTATATANLDGTVSDADGDPLTTTWIQVSGPVSTIASPSAVDTTAILSTAGTYTFRLTANDGSGPVSDDVVITVNPASAYDAWMEAAGLGGGVDGTFNGDANGDGMVNGLGWLLGATNPNENGSALMPQMAQSGGDLTLFFKMLNSTKRGAAVLSLQYSNDLGVSDPWTNRTIPVPDVTGQAGGLNFVINPISGTDHNQVQVTIPSSAAGGTGKVFARMRGVLSP